MSQTVRHRSASPQPERVLEAANEAPALRELRVALDDPDTQRRASAPTLLADPPPARAPIPAQVHWLGECTDERHPVFSGRVRVRRLDAGDDSATNQEPPSEEQSGVWLSVLQGLAVRKADRLLVAALPGSEDVVIGVLDGLRRREQPVREGGPQIELPAGAALTVTQADGTRLLEIIPSAGGPVVRLLQADTRVELPGKLEIRASEIELVAQRGPVRLEASDDIVVVGETIRLN
jgi:hypothetical protein